MGTRAQLEFRSAPFDPKTAYDPVVKGQESWTRECRIYQHWDGYPEYTLIAIYRAYLLMYELRDSDMQEAVDSPFLLGESAMKELSTTYILANCPNLSGAISTYVDKDLHGDLEFIYQVEPNLDNMTQLWITIYDSEWKLIKQGVLQDLIAEECVQVIGGAGYKDYVSEVKQKMCVVNEAIMKEIKEKVEKEGSGLKALVDDEGDEPDVKSENRIQGDKFIGIDL